MRITGDHDSLLAFLLRVQPDEVSESNIRRLPESEWERLIFQSERSYIAPILYERVVKHKDLVPSGPINRLRQGYLYNLTRNMRLYSGLHKVLTVLENNAIDVIALKGAHLAALVYRNIGLRYMTDLDILIKKEDLPKVDMLLTELGYLLQRDGLDHPFHHRYIDSKSGICFEIHFHISQRLDFVNIDVAGLWNRARPTIINGNRVLVLSPEDMILYTCLHDAVHHNYNLGLRTLCDLAECTRHFQREIDWDQVYSRSLQWNTGKCTYLTLHLARHLLGVDLPEDLLSALKPESSLTEVLSWAQQTILGEMYPRSLLISENFAQLVAKKELKQRIAILMKIAFPARKTLEEIYPDSGWKAYLYRLRDLRLLYGRSLGRMLYGDQEVRRMSELEISRVSLRQWLWSA